MKESMENVETDVMREKKKLHFKSFISTYLLSVGAHIHTGSEDVFWIHMRQIKAKLSHDHVC